MSIETEVTVLWDDFAGFWTNTVWPGLKNLLKTTVTNEVNALAPIAESAVATIEADLKAVTNLSGAATVIGNVFTSVASQAEAAAVNAGAASLVTAVSSALGNLLSTTAPASAPQTPVSPPPAG